jgi:hypothetical protein
MEERLPSGNRNAAAGLFVKGLVFEHLGHHLIYRHFPAYLLARLSVARRYARAARFTLLTEGKVTIPLFFHCVVWTRIKTVPAFDAAILAERKLDLRTLAFRIVTP